MEPGAGGFPKSSFFLFFRSRRRLDSEVAFEVGSESDFGANWGRFWIDLDIILEDFGFKVDGKTDIDINKVLLNFLMLFQRISAHLLSKKNVIYIVFSRCFLNIGYCQTCCVIDQF